MRPTPTQVTPTSNQSFEFYFVRETLPVGIIVVQGCGPLIPFISWVAPSISSISQHSEAIGRQATETFLKCVQSEHLKQTLSI